MVTRHVARTHRRKEQGLALRGHEGQRPSHAGNEIGEVGQCPVLAGISVNEHGHPTVAGHCVTQRRQPYVEFVARQAVLVPQVGAEHDRGVRRQHGDLVTP